MKRHQLWRTLLTVGAEIDRQVVNAARELPSSATASLAASGVGMPRFDTLPQYETSWRELGGAAASARALSLASPPASKSPESPSLGERERLAELRVQIRARLDALWRQLEGELGYDRVRRALVIYFDERVMTLLPEHLRLSWPLLQTEVTRSTTGGSDFFRHIDETLDDPKAPSLVFEVHYFCIAHGFVGMYVHDPVRLDEYKLRLVSRISLPAGAHTGAAAELEPERLPISWPVWTYHLIAVGFVAGIMLLMTLWSNSTSAEHAGDSRVQGRLAQ